MARIKFNFDGLNGDKREISARISDLKGMNDRLNRLIENIGTTWKGRAARRYLEKMRSYKTQSENMITVLTEFEKYIDKAESVFEQKDREWANKINGC